MNTKWNDILSHLAAKLDSSAYKVWIAPLKCEFKPGDVLTITAPSGFVADYVSSHYGADISSAATQVLGKKPRLVFKGAPIVLPEKKKQVASQQITKEASKTEQTCFVIRTPQKLPTFKHAFSDFVVGDCNRMAYTAASELANNSGQVNTLFISSASGLGKTHLMQSVGFELISSSNYSTPRIEYLSAENFASAFVHAAQAHDYDNFKSRFHNTDVLLLEDVHFLRGKDKFQEELLSAVRDLQENGKRVVISSSFSPKELSDVDPSLVSRFCSGFLVGIDKPDTDTKRRILIDKANSQGVRLSDDVIDMMANSLNGDIRQLLSCLHSLLLKSKVQSQFPNIAMAREIIAQYEQTMPFIDIDSITKCVCEAFGIEPEILRSRSRKNNYVLARGIIFYLARMHTDLSLASIGQTFGRKHSTVLKGISNVEHEMNKETTTGRQISSLISRIEARAR